MNIRHIAKLAAAATLALGTALATPITIPTDALGNYQTIKITGHTSAMNLNGGGMFTGFIGNWAAQFFCVDYDNYTGIPTTYKGDVVSLGDGYNSNYVQKGNTAASSFTNIKLMGSDLAYHNVNVQQRYEIAAELMSQTGLWQTGTKNTTTDQNLQNAAWAALDLASGSQIKFSSLNSVAKGMLEAAVTKVLTNPGNYNNFALVSGTALANGTLVNCPKEQTFLVALQPHTNPPGDVPEPATYAMMGAGLLGLAAFKLRRK